MRQVALWLLLLHLLLFLSFLSIEQQEINLRAGRLKAVMIMLFLSNLVWGLRLYELYLGGVAWRGCCLQPWQFLINSMPD